MKKVTPYARLFDVADANDGIRLLKKIEFIGRFSHRSEEYQTDVSWDRFIRANVVQHGDWSITEHSSATVDMLVDRGITHEVVRHRLFSYTQESTRFVNYEKKMPASAIKPHMKSEAAGMVWQEAMSQAELHYKALIELGEAPQIARSVFPTALSSRIAITGNLRNWRHFFLMRTTREAHPQIREVCIPLLEEFQAKIPILYEDIVPMARQVENIAKGR